MVQLKSCTTSKSRLLSGHLSSPSLQNLCSSLFPKRLDSLIINGGGRFTGTLECLSRALCIHVALEFAVDACLVRLIRN